MTQQFQILIRGTVQSSGDATDPIAELFEMKQAVEDSFKPDLQWGVSYDTFEIQMPETSDMETPS